MHNFKTQTYTLRPVLLNNWNQLKQDRFDQMQSFFNTNNEFMTEWEIYRLK